MTISLNYYILYKKIGVTLCNLTTETHEVFSCLPYYIKDFYKHIFPTSTGRLCFFAFFRILIYEIYGEIMRYFWAILLQLILIGLNAVFACAEIAVISMNEAKLNLLASKGGKDAKKAKKLEKLTADPARFLSTIQVAITLAGFLGSAFAADMFAEPLVAAIMRAGAKIPQSVVSPVIVVLITLVLAFFNIVLGELVPKRVAMKNAEGVSKSLTGLLGFVSVAFKPIVALLSLATNGVLRLFGISPEDKGEEVTEEDILMMAEVGKESGNIETQENELIKNIFEFSELTIGEICTHRKEVDFLSTEQSIEQWEEKIRSTRHSYYPICGETADDIRGVLDTKSYFRLKEITKESVLNQAVLQPLFLYENVSASKVFQQMKNSHEYFGIVMDEYGGVAGIITIHDLLEAIVGDMNEKNEPAEYTVEEKNGVWEINGLAPFAKVESALGIKLPLEEDEEYETFSGYVCSLLDTLPDDDTQLSLSTEQLDVHILTIEGHCITKMQVSVRPVEEEDNDE